MGTEIALIALKLLHETAKKIPNFDERVRKNYYDAIVALEAEYMKPEHTIDDQKMDLLRINVEKKLEAFEKEISK